MLTMRAGQSRYEAPVVRDYGDLVAVTAAIHPRLAAGMAPDLSFSSALHPAGAGGDSGAGAGGGSAPFHAPVAGGTSASPSAQGLHATPTGGLSGLTHGSPGGTAGSGAASAGGAAGSAGGGGGGGGTLPFTGFVASIAAALGSGMAVAGATLRRSLRRRAG